MFGTKNSKTNWLQKTIEYKHRFELYESLNPLFFTSSPNNSASKTMKNAAK